MTARRCPTCKTAHQDDGRPGCGCTAKERATAPDFSPLLIRPHIKVREFADQEEPGAGTAALGEHAPGSDDRGTSSVTGMPEAAPAEGQSKGPAGSGDHDGSEPTIAVGQPGTAGRAGRTPAGEGRRRRRAGTVAGVSVAVLAVSAALVGTWLIAENSFSDAGPDRHAAAPTLIMPTDDGAHPSVFPSQSESAAHGTSAPPSAGSSASATGHPTATSSHGASADGSAGPTSSASSGGDADSSDDDAPPVLKKGSTGPEVADLQRRLKQVGGLYDDDADGVYDDGVRDAVATFQQWRSIQGDPSGVYGSHTREELERETGGPS